MHHFSRRGLRPTRAGNWEFWPAVGGLEPSNITSERRDFIRLITQSPPVEPFIDYLHIYTTIYARTYMTIETVSIALFASIVWMQKGLIRGPQITLATSGSQRYFWLISQSRSKHDLVFVNLELSTHCKHLYITRCSISKRISMWYENASEWMVKSNFLLPKVAYDIIWYNFKDYDKLSVATIGQVFQDIIIHYTDWSTNFIVYAPSWVDWRCLALLLVRLQPMKLSILIW